MTKFSDMVLNALTPDQRQSFVISFTAFLSSLLLLALLSILVLVIYRGSAYFWPADIYRATFSAEAESDEPITAYSRIFNTYEDNGHIVRWLEYSYQGNAKGIQSLVDENNIINLSLASDAAEISLQDGRSILGVPQQFSSQSEVSTDYVDYQAMRENVLAAEEEIEAIRTRYLSEIHESLAELDVRKVEADAPARIKLNNAFSRWQKKVEQLEFVTDSYIVHVALADGSQVIVPMSEIAAITYPGRLSWFGKMSVALRHIGHFLIEAPKQANTAGGVFPALFGTVLMVFIMTIIVTPFGVLAAVYLSEYAPNNMLTSAIRISVSNMAGVPSIVYGVFGLGFFVYTLGGSIDAFFFADRHPAPVMGTPGVFWASLTMAILTLPVVIVATEEGLRRVPNGLRAGSYALGATKAETILHTVLPIASPGIMTGVILAIARAAGEVAPLMLVGAVKFAPNLPLDSEFPYLHLDRQFMHLGVLIYDGAFHSQTDAKGASMMFAACLLLLLVVVILNILAVWLRTRLRKRYQII